MSGYGCPDPQRPLTPRNQTLHTVKSLHHTQATAAAARSAPSTRERKPLKTTSEHSLVLGLAPAQTNGEIITLGRFVINARAMTFSATFVNHPFVFFDLQGNFHRDRLNGSLHAAITSLTQN
jgi:hypothetical protein